METVSVYRKKYTVGINDVDFTKKLKLSALFGYFQDVASFAVENLHIGIDVLTSKFSVSWVLVRIRVDIDRIPSWNEEITVETWPQEPGKLEFERDYAVLDKEGQVIIRAVSSWVLFDIHTREPRRSDLIAFHFPPFIKDRAIECKLSKLKPPGEAEIAYKKVIGYSDVDLNGHINNSKYIDFIMDCFSVEKHRQYDVKTIEVNYVNEAMPGETLMMRRGISALEAGRIYIDGVNVNNEKTVFRAQLEIVAKEQE